MAEVYIRTQDREALYFLASAAGVRYSTETNTQYKSLPGGKIIPIERNTYTVSLIDLDDCDILLGKYESKERCLEVIDGIQKACTQYMYSGNGMISANVPAIFEMPET